MGRDRAAIGGAIPVSDRFTPASVSPMELRKQAARRAMLRLCARRYVKPATPNSMPCSILLIRPDHVGDLLFLTPALHALRLELASAHITLLAGPWSDSVVRANPDLDALRVCSFPGFERHRARRRLPSPAPYRALLATARQLRASAYDTAVVLRFDHWWGAWLAAEAGIPRRIGYDWPETRPFLTDVVPYNSDRHEVEQNAALVAALVGGEASRPGPTRFAITEAERTWANCWLAERGALQSQPLVAIHPGAGAPVKQWPTSAWIEVAEGLATLGAQVLLTGGGGERELTQSILQGLTRPALDAAGETTLGQLAALQERCSLVMGPDCGPLHLAVAVDTPTVHLYGPVAPAKFGPWGDPERHIVLTTDWECAPCNRLDWPPETLTQHRCMAAIRPAEVLAAASRLLQNPSGDIHR